MARLKKNDEPLLRAMADIIVGGEIDLPSRGKSEGITMAARVVLCFATTRPPTDADVDRLRKKYAKQQDRLEAGARERLASGEATAIPYHVTGLGVGSPGRGVAYHDSRMARSVGDFMADAMQSVLQAINPDALRDRKSTRALAETLDCHADLLEKLAACLRVTGKLLSH